VALDLAVDSKSVSVGDVFEVRVEIEAVKSVHNVPVTLSFDGALLEVQSIEDGGFMGSGQDVVFMADSHLAGTVVLGVSLLGDGADGVTGSGIVARITMKAVASGDARIRFEKGKPLNENLKAVTPNSRSEVKIEIGAGALAGPDGK